MLEEETGRQLARRGRRVASSRVGSIAFLMTGLSEEVARFQALSAFSAWQKRAFSYSASSGTVKTQLELLRPDRTSVLSFLGMEEGHVKLFLRAVFCTLE